MVGWRSVGGVQSGGDWCFNGCLCRLLGFGAHPEGGRQTGVRWRLDGPSSRSGALRVVLLGETGLTGVAEDQGRRLQDEHDERDQAQRLLLAPPAQVQQLQPPAAATKDLLHLPHHVGRVSFAQPEGGTRFSFVLFFTKCSPAAGAIAFLVGIDRRSDVVAQPLQRLRRGQAFAGHFFCLGTDCRKG